MTRKKKISVSLVRDLEQTHSETLEKADRFYEILIKLRYEGKVSLGKNCRDAKEVLKFFSGEHHQHMECEERIIFPFLKTHVPKLESIIHLLLAEHRDFKRNLLIFEHSIHELDKGKNDSERATILEKIKEVGTYLIYLLKSHNQFESASVYKVIDQELHPDEVEEIEKQIRRAG